MAQKLLIFTDEDFSVFKKANVSDKKYDPLREKIANKLLDLHKALLPMIKSAGLDLHPHWRSQHIVSNHKMTSSTKIEDIWLRYGKSQSQITALNDSLQKNDGASNKTFNSQDNLSFINHAHISIGLEKTNFYVQMVISKNKAFTDLQRLKEKINDPKYLARLLNEFKKLKGLGCFLWKGKRYTDSNDERHLYIDDAFDQSLLKKIIEKQASDERYEHFLVLKPFSFDLFTSVQLSPKKIFECIKEFYPLYLFILKG